MIGFLTRRPPPRQQIGARMKTGRVCPVCGSDQFVYLFAVGQTRFSRCVGCELVSLERRQQEAQTASQAAIALSESIPSEQGDELDAALLRRAVDAVRSANAGTATGSGLMQIAHFGDCTTRQKELALQIGAHLTEIPLSSSAEDIQSTTRLSIPSPHWPPFQACILKQPLETQKDPGSVLRAVHRLLAPHGVVVTRSAGLLSTTDHFHGHSVRFDRDTDYLYTSEAAISLLFGAGFGRIKIAALANPSLPGNAKPSVKNTELQHGALILARKRYQEDPALHRNKLSIVMPVFNEKATFRQVFDLVHAKQLNDVDKEIIIVESNSRDGTREDVLAVADYPGVTVILEERPQGKGHAVRQGLQRATGDFIIIQDADLEYDIEDYDLLLDPLVTNRAAFILGIRHGTRGDSWKMRQFKDEFFLGELMNVGHLLLTTLFNVVYRQRLVDPFTMFKVFRRDCIEDLKLECNRFDFDWELVAKLVRRGYIPVEIPVNYVSRSFGEGKKVDFIKDPITWVRACFKYRFTRV